mmetsp:Transcript_41141/g.103713  ORF Transcript_41141/g.103713 Transcript_41141/m.103713 type:complete len:278 (-) Transcript_41141:637-1470(-)
MCTSVSCATTATCRPTSCAPCAAFVDWPRTARVRSRVVAAASSTSPNWRPATRISAARTRSCAPRTLASTRRCAMPLPPPPPWRARVTAGGQCRPATPRRPASVCWSCSSRSVSSSAPWTVQTPTLVRCPCSPSWAPPRSHPRRPTRAVHCSLSKQRRPTRSGSKQLAPALLRSLSRVHSLRYRQTCRLRRPLPRPPSPRCRRSPHWPVPWLPHHHSTSPPARTTLCPLLSPSAHSAALSSWRGTTRRTPRPPRWCSATSARSTWTSSSRTNDSAHW